MPRPAAYPAPAPRGKIGVVDACSILGVSKPTLYRLMKREGFPEAAKERGYTWFDRAALERWKDQHAPG